MKLTAAMACAHVMGIEIDLWRSLRGQATVRGLHKLRWVWRKGYAHHGVAARVFRPHRDGQIGWSKC